MSHTTLNKYDGQGSEPDAIKHRGQISYFRRLFDESPVGLAVVSVGQRIDYVNSRLCTILGFSEDELLGLYMKDIMHPNDWDAHCSIFERLIKRETHHSRIELRFVKKNGVTIWVCLSISMVRDDDGQPFYYLPMVDDITEKKNTMEDLTKFKQGIEQSGDVTFITTKNGHILYVNPAFTRIYGYSPEEVIGKTPRILKSGQHAHDHYQVFWNRLSSGESVKGEFINKKKDGRFVSMEASANPIFNEAHSLIGYLAIQRDITERKKAEEDLKNAKKLAESANIAKSVFLANMSHELRTPLNGILGMAQLLLEPYYGEMNIEQKKFTENILRSGYHLLELINELLDLSKIESGKMEYVIDDFSPALIIDEAVSLLRANITEKNISLSIHADNTYILRNDERKYRQVVINLLSNSVKFSNRDGTITIRLNPSLDRKFMIFSITDTGVGIRKEDYGKIFQFFQQVDATYTRKGEGTGLGLAISKKMIEGMGGHIWFESEYGNGSTFSFSVPTAKKGESRIIHTDDQPDDHMFFIPVSEKNERTPLILIIEDNILNADVVVNLLEANGFEAVHIDNAEEGIEYARLHNPMLILMDIQLNGMDGMEASKLLKSDPVTSHIPIFALTAYAMKGDEEKLYEIGIERYIKKPFNTKMFLKTISEFLEKRTPRNQ